jgi:hypothetical protein
MASNSRWGRVGSLRVESELADGGHEKVHDGDRPNGAAGRLSSVTSRPGHSARGATSIMEIVGQRRRRSDVLLNVVRG